MSDDLRERVAHLFRTMYATEADRRVAADAAIAIIRGEVLEEAARLADVMGKQDEGTDGHGVAYEVAAAIRALKDKP